MSCLLLQDAHFEGAHEHHGHALAGDVLAGREQLAGRGVVALDEALLGSPGEGAARLAGSFVPVGEAGEVAPL